MAKIYYIYPAVFHYDPDVKGVGVTFPDLPGCVSHGEDEEDAFRMAQEALAGHLYTMMENKEEIPAPSKLSEINLEEYKEEGEQVALVLVSVSKKAVQEIGQKSVKKTLTIPKWLNDLGEKHDVNFSQILQEALKHHLGVNH
ncbi:type II toxin-antitoxin system HicB family antitoxin [Lihuaxuella thermophila]|uniref:Predicted nuclease of the RNAse H fold, HicB family n=1 Tax=Lihuaxuella thermophila TaxID=1173111 RepID=A0A1H8JBR9_9BACL|nr:type II toxin-antitoxin system HicB family antitoxin [Lihuaxuella thermophila]SEN53559.1 Predicted nuclease of the RNAse H fold, HicB family [Lihuaxuella thermophila]SEN78041.1 Predicted nuclease of the RNAse H fold, HicB family [Lihuaxuella thermophila]SEN80544.1 Predicted nuclease of the RNAse H fold, HicB family [Lihuaxuella thermophila]